MSSEIFAAQAQVVHAQPSILFAGPPSRVIPQSFEEVFPGKVCFSCCCPDPQEITIFANPAQSHPWISRGNSALSLPCGNDPHQFRSCSGPAVHGQILPFLLLTLTNYPERWWNMITFFSSLSMISNHNSHVSNCFIPFVPVCFGILPCSWQCGLSPARAAEPGSRQDPAILMI